MAIEIERKFLTRDDGWRANVESESRILQGYLSADGRLTVRARMRGEQGYLTIKGASRGLARSEFEYEIPPADVESMLAELAQGALIEKRRHLVREQGWVWEVDEFSGENQGLVLAEIELPDAEQPFPRPTWLGEEVSEDSRYFNASLVRHPFSRW